MNPLATHAVQIQAGLETGRPRTLRYIPQCGPKQVAEALAELSPEWDLSLLLVVHLESGALQCVQRASTYREQVAACAAAKPEI